MHGNTGTFTTFFFRFREHYQAYIRQVQQQQVAPSAPPSYVDLPTNWHNTAFVDPSDPTTLYLAQPSVPSAPSAPVYSPIYGNDTQAYQDTGLKP